MARQLEKKRALQGNVCAQRPIERAQRPNNLHCIEQPTMPRHERPPPRTRPAETRVLSTETSYGLGAKSTHRAVFAIRPDQVLVLRIRHLAQQDISADDFV